MPKYPPPKEIVVEEPEEKEVNIPPREIVIKAEDKAKKLVPSRVQRIIIDISEASWDARVALFSALEGLLTGKVSDYVYVGYVEGEKGTVALPVAEALEQQQIDGLIIDVVSTSSKEKQEPLRLYYVRIMKKPGKNLNPPFFPQP